MKSTKTHLPTLAWPLVMTLFLAALLSAAEYLDSATDDGHHERIGCITDLQCELMHIDA